MPTVAHVFARTLADLGVARMYGLPGGEILDLVEACRLEGIRFVLTRREATASFMADAAGQLERRPGVAVATLGPGAVNMVLGVANAYLDRSPVLAITASLATSVAPYSTHQNLDLNAVYRPFTKASWTLDGRGTEARVREAWALAKAARPGPVHLALPSDVARMEDQPAAESRHALSSPVGPPAQHAIEWMRAVIGAARRPVVILGLDLAPYERTEVLTQFIETLGVPVFVAPKAKGAWPETHPLFCGVCAGVAADHVIVDFFRQADLLLGIGYDPVESNRAWHHAMRLASIGPLSIAADAFRPYAECVGEVDATLGALLERPLGPFEWRSEDIDTFRAQMAACLQPSAGGLEGHGGRERRGVSPCQLTRRLRALTPADAIVTTDVGAVKFITSQVFTVDEPMRFLQSNGLSSMGFALPAAMAARLVYPDRPVLCTVGDGGFGMSLAEVETCVRERLHFVIVVYNDRQLSLIQVIQQNKGLPPWAVEYGDVDFAAAARALGAVGYGVTSLDELDGVMAEAWERDRLVVVDVRVDPREYASHTRPCGL
ncbi:MAG: thiamine pyrophosphate-binding protein [Bacteroidales bacterium]